MEKQSSARGKKEANFLRSLWVCGSSQAHESAQRCWSVFLVLEEQWIIVYICGSKLDSCGASSHGINQLSLLASLSQNWLSWRGSVEPAVTHKLSQCSHQGAVVAWLVDLESVQLQLFWGMARRIGALQRQRWIFKICSVELSCWCIKERRRVHDCDSEQRLFLKSTPRILQHTPMNPLGWGFVLVCALIKVAHVQHEEE